MRSKVGDLKKKFELDRGNTASPNGGSNTNITKNDPMAKMIKWCQEKTKSYKNVSITNLSSSWADGMAFCALMHQYAPDAIDFDSLNPSNREENLAIAFKVAKDRAQIEEMITVDEMLKMGDNPDKKCIFTYLSFFPTAFAKK